MLFASPRVRPVPRGTNCARRRKPARRGRHLTTKVGCPCTVPLRHLSAPSLCTIQGDPSEHVDLRVSMPALFALMHARLMVLARSTYQTAYIQPGIKCLEPEQAKTYYKGFRGPPCFNTSDFPVVPTPPPAPSDTFQLASPDGVWCLTGHLGQKVFREVFGAKYFPAGLGATVALPGHR